MGWSCALSSNRGWFSHRVHSYNWQPRPFHSFLVVIKLCILAQIRCNAATAASLVFNSACNSRVKGALREFQHSLVGKLSLPAIWPGAWSVWPVGSEINNFKCKFRACECNGKNRVQVHQFVLRRFFSLECKLTLYFSSALHNIIIYVRDGTYHRDENLWFQCPEPRTRKKLFSSHHYIHLNLDCGLFVPSLRQLLSL